MTPPASRPLTECTLSVIVPAYNEQEVLPEFHQRLARVFATLPFRAEVVYVNDGSNDQTLSVLQALRQGDPRVSIVDLSRNFGKEIALAAGLDHISGDAVVIIDADLQDPPELIPRLLQAWQEGYDNVYARRTRRDGETWVKRMTAHLFYRVIQSVSRVRIPEDTGDFRLLSRRAVESLRQLREQHRFMKGLFAWIGYPSIGIDYQRDARAAGQTKWNYWRLWNLALEGITSFTIAPLKVATYIGVLIGLLAFVYASIVIYKTLVFGDPVQGYPSLMVVVLLLGGANLIAVGMLGEYLGRMFDETKSRPLYFVNAFVPSHPLCSMDVAAQEPATTWLPPQRDLELRQ
jgi:polyisoprenyl-phosphate glycosyltransferase